MPRPPDEARAPPRSAREIYRFAEFEVDRAAYELRRDGRRIRLSPQPMDLLLLLLAHRQELISREQMAGVLWAPDVFTDLEAGIRTAIQKIRQALGDSRESPRYVETVPGKGYRFIAPIEVDWPSPTTASPRSTAADLSRHNLADERTSFVGRQKELADLSAALATSPLLSLTGAGGIGKTRWRHGSRGPSRSSSLTACG